MFTRGILSALLSRAATAPCGRSWLVQTEPQPPGAAAPFSFRRIGHQCRIGHHRGAADLLRGAFFAPSGNGARLILDAVHPVAPNHPGRSEEHTSELQSP